MHERLRPNPLATLHFTWLMYYVLGFYFYLFYIFEFVCLELHSIIFLTGHHNNLYT